MSACDQVRLLLGPFDDGELEPHEMEDVALHVVSCMMCKAALEDYRSLGVALRDCVRLPATEGFTDAVLHRINQVPQPIHLRVSRYFDSIAEHVGASLSLVAAGAFAALATLWLMTPYLHRLLQRLPASTPVASTKNDSELPTGQSPPIIVSNDPATTVIWVPNQP
jgi:anti-sigma factor RsiW